MARQPQRTVQAALVEGIGLVTSDELLAMDENSWGIWRDRITDRRMGKDGLTARCMLCNDAVYIRTARLNGTSLPLFAHYSGSDPDCPWYQGYNSLPEAARAEQYQGQQESDFHRLKCEQVAELISLDERHIRHTINKYLPPTQNAHGRFPDVYVEWEEFGPFAVEVQVSNTFQTEISARCKHYEYEGIPLLWILVGLNPRAQVQQSFLDVIRRHRGNAFVLDPEAIAESRKQKTLVLKCYTRPDSNFDIPKLVRFDSLTLPTSKLPYHEDCIIGPRLAQINRRRQPWFKELDKWDRDAALNGLESPQNFLVAAAFSIVREANGKPYNYASVHENIKGMLNSYLYTGKLAPYARLLTHLIKNTSADYLLEETVGKHLLRHRAGHQADEKSFEWGLLRKLIPEALDPIIRDQFVYLDALPKWATPSSGKR